MIIDGHAHMGGEYCDLPSILKTLDHAGIDKVILCPSDKKRLRDMVIPMVLGKAGGRNLNFIINRLLRTATTIRGSGEFIERGNEEVYKIAVNSGGRVLQFYWADPLRQGIAAELEDRFSRWHFKGIKLHQGCHPFKIVSEPFHEIAAFAALNDLPVFIHLFSKKEISDFITVAGNYSTRFISGHIIGIEHFLKGKSNVSDNVYFDISCPPLVSYDRIMKTVDGFGPGRLVMGSDVPFGRDNALKAVSLVRSLPVSETEREMILGRNLREILRV